jgi:hypothetical protein
MAQSNESEDPEGRTIGELGGRKKHYHGYSWGGVIGSAILGGGGGLFVLVCALLAALVNPALRDHPLRWPIGIGGSLLGVAVIGVTVWLCRFLYRSGPEFDIHERGAVYHHRGEVKAFLWTDVRKVRVNMAVTEAAAHTAGSRLLILFRSPSSRSEEAELRSGYFQVKYLLEILKRLTSQVGRDRIEEQEWT